MLVISHSLLSSSSEASPNSVKEEPLCDVQQQKTDHYHELWRWVGGGGGGEPMDCTHPELLEPAATESRESVHRTETRTTYITCSERNG